MKNPHTSTQMKKVLLLGDGNFSFALSAAQRLRNEHVELTATSFDSRAALLEKYPESASILERLEDQKHVTVLHEVDATQIARRFPAASFGEIWFNFPHLGREDMASHRSLLAHYFHSAMGCVGDGGVICVALSEDQQRNWDMHASAQRLGLTCIAAVAVVAEQWPGYSQRRHHSGRSFAKKVQQCFHYCFRKVDDTSTVMPLLASLSLQAAVQLTGKTIPTKRIHFLVADKYEHLDGQFVCSVCQKCFSSEDGVRTHVYTVHILCQSASENNVLLCPQCNKTCANADALKQHEIAKHTGEHTLIRPYWKQPAADELAGDTEEEAAVLGALCDCEICGWKFATADQLTAHLQGGLTPVDEEKSLVCGWCGESFGQERALQQHRNFCSVAAVYADHGKGEEEVDERGQHV